MEVPGVFETRSILEFLYPWKTSSNIDLANLQNKDATQMKIAYEIVLITVKKCSNVEPTNKMLAPLSRSAEESVRNAFLPINIVLILNWLSGSFVCTMQFPSSSELFSQMQFELNKKIPHTNRWQKTLVIVFLSVQSVPPNSAQFTEW